VVGSSAVLEISIMIDVPVEVFSSYALISDENNTHSSCFCCLSDRSSQANPTLLGLSRLCAVRADMSVLQHKTTNQTAPNQEDQLMST
jgi:hypothetical protein